jgi:hypothetical protein
VRAETALWSAAVAAAFFSPFLALRPAKSYRVRPWKKTRDSAPQPVTHKTTSTMNTSAILLAIGILGAFERSRGWSKRRSLAPARQISTNLAPEALPQPSHRLDVISWDSHKMPRRKLLLVMR